MASRCMASLTREIRHNSPAEPSRSRASALVPREGTQPRQRPPFLRPDQEPANAPILVVRGVTKRFGSGLKALDGVDLTVARGEFLSLLGPSGCGKSTLLRIVAGLSEPSAGSCTLHLGGAERGRRIPTGRIGFVFQ